MIFYYLSISFLVLLHFCFFARRDDFVGQVGNLRPIVNRPALWGGQSWLSRLSAGFFAFAAGQFLLV